ncbi:Uncharacterised protein [Elizabethkingia anophelis]|nr:Uncharacterised protein [Elizabethkingia anophelis]
MAIGNNLLVNREFSIFNKPLVLAMNNSLFDFYINKKFFIL